jgi:multidrug efflux pump subunit AcrA (membrane-fusion protein)
MSISAMCIALLCAATAQPGGNIPNSVTINNCLVSLDKEAEVAAQEAGVLLKLPAEEGQHVKKGELLAQIDDKLPQREQDVANYKLGVAQEQARNDINVRYAKAAADVAEAVYHRDVDSNNKVQGSVPLALVQQHLLEQKAAILSIEKSQLELRIADLQSKVSEAELAAATEKVDRRRIKSPLDGQVQKINRHVGEWVQAGEPVLRVVQVNRLRVEGFLNISEFAPEEINGRPVTVKVVFARGRTETFNGKIVFVDPMVESQGNYKVRALVQNTEDAGHQLLLRAGMDAEMTIQLK